MFDGDDEHTVIDDQLAARISSAESRRHEASHAGEMILVASTSSGERFAVRRGQPSVWIGSSPSVDWQLSHAGVAARHVEIAVDERSLWICAHDAATLDGRKLLGWAPAPSGARLIVGGVSIDLEHLAMTPELQVDAAPAPDDPRPASGEERFAMPPADDEGARPRATRSWRGPAVTLGILAAAAAIAWASRGRGVEAAVDRAPARPGATVVVPTPPPSARMAAPSDDRAAIRTAARALLEHDYPSALAAYRELAAADGAYAAFVRALEARLAEEAPAGGD